MIVKLTPAGEDALWSWASKTAKDAESLSRHLWIAAAHRQINLSGNGIDGFYRIWISGAKSANGHLQSLILEPGWFSVLPNPVNRSLSVATGLVVI